MKKQTESTHVNSTAPPVKGWQGKTTLLLRRLLQPAVLAVVATLMLLHAAIARDVQASAGTLNLCIPYLQKYCTGYDQYNVMFSWCCNYDEACGSTVTTWLAITYNTTNYTAVGLTRFDGHLGGGALKQKAHT